MLNWLKKRLGIVDVPRLSAQEAQERVKAGALLLDVRTPLERKTSQIPGSKAMPLDKLAKEWASLPADREIICQCASGNRSAQAAQFLLRQGLKASNLAGGITAWQAAGLPLKRS